MGLLGLIEKCKVVRVTVGLPPVPDWESAKVATLCDCGSANAILDVVGVPER